MKTFVRIVLSILIMISSIAFPFPIIKVKAADYTATVNFSTTSPRTIELGMAGFHQATVKSVDNLDDTNIIDLVKSYGSMSWIRMQGTTANVLDLKTGAVGNEMLGQIQENELKYYVFGNGYKSAAARGYERMESYRELAQQTGAKLIITCNVSQQSSREIGEIAKYLYDNHVPVLYFELGNEVDFFTAETNNTSWPNFWKTGTDYLDRMRSYSTLIKSNYPGAKVVTVMSNLGKNAFDQDYYNYSNPYWDAVTFHRFLGNGVDFDDAMLQANEELHSWDNVINDYLSHLQDQNTPFTVNEISTGLAGPLALTQYNGIVVAESMLRLSKRSNIKHFQSWRLTGGIATPAENYQDKLLDAYQRGETVDTDALNFQYYDQAPGEAAHVVDVAINNSSGVYTTTTTGGTTVQRDNGTMPALYAQAYKGANGKDYVVITNKSAYSHDVTVQQDGTNVNQQMTRTYVTSARDAKNAPSDIQVAIQSGTVTAGDPVFVPPYSVTRVEWTRTSTLDIPPVPWLSHAVPQNGKVDLRWLPTPLTSGYKIKYGTDPNNMSTPIDVGNVTSYPITGLTNGLTYYFSVAAYNATGTSPYSNEVLQNGVVYNNVFVNLAAPDTPIMNLAQKENKRQVSVGWKSVPGATGYKLKYGTTSGVYTNVIDVGNAVGMIVGDLTNETIYYFAVTAYNSFGESAISSEMSVAPSGGIPLAPHHLDITSENSTSVSLSWIPTLKDKQTYYFEGSGTSSDWTEEAGIWSVVNHFDSNRNTYVYQSDSSSPAISIFSSASQGDLEGSARVEINGSFSSGNVGVIANYTNINNYYRFNYNAVNDDFRIIEMEGGVGKIRAQISRSNLSNNVDPNDMTMRISVQNGVVTAKLNSYTVMSWTDSTPLASGYFGLYSSGIAANFDMVELKKDVALSYDIYRATNPDFPENFSKVAGNVTGTTWSDSGLNSANKYYYRVFANNNFGVSSGHSNTVMKY